LKNQDELDINLLFKSYFCPKFHQHQTIDTNMVKLSAVIITFNEEEHLEKCLVSLQQIADEIVVIDSYSTDQTKTICDKYDVNFIEQSFLGYKEQKNFAVDKASYDHILSLDGDEALSDQLIESIKQLKENWKLDGYYVKRKNNYAGYWVKYSNWYPDKKLRLFVKGRGKWYELEPNIFKTRPTEFKNKLIKLQSKLHQQSCET